jgi:hypothetical protein
MRQMPEAFIKHADKIKHHATKALDYVARTAKDG